MYAAVDEAADKLYRQLNRQKERLKSHHHGRAMDTEPIAVEDAGMESQSVLEAPTPRAAGEGTIVQIERLEVEPQFEEEAIQDMEALGHDFHVFLNARNERMSVLYRRRDGGYGLIEPHVAR
jgi:putative sigma-54 modulation protein